MNGQLFDPIRKAWVKATPEELVRNQLIHNLVNKLGFPAELVVVEKGLRQMPHLKIEDGMKVPARRADLVCFARGIHPHLNLDPLLLVECKAVEITPQVIRQVTGYNHFLRAHFIAVVNQFEVVFGYYQTSVKQYCLIQHIPSYATLIEMAALTGIA